MSIKICMNPSTNEDRHRTRLFGEIYFRVDDFAFPSPAWGDFVCIVLSWWTRAIGDFDDKPVALGFMDGPFELRLTPSVSEMVNCSCVRRGYERDTTLDSFTVKLEELRESLKTAVLATIDYHESESRSDVEELREAWDRHGW